MAAPSPDHRSAARQSRDESIAAESPLPQPVVPPSVKPQPVESHLRQRRPVAFAGVVENGLVRPLDPAVKLAERSRVIIVATDGN